MLLHLLRQHQEYFQVREVFLDLKYLLRLSIPACLSKLFYNFGSYINYREYFTKNIEVTNPAKCY